MSSEKPTIVGLAISMPLIATGVIVLRFWSRVLQKSRIDVDDYLIVVSLIFCIGLSIASLTAVYLGNLGGHLEVTPGKMPVHPEQFTPFAKSLYVVQWIAILAVGPTKMSVLWFYKRIFVSRSFQITAWVGFSLALVWTIAFFLVQFLNCLPIDVNWRLKLGTTGRCLPITALFWATTVSDIVTDAIILALPWYQIYKLQMSLTRKLQVGFAFLLGAFVVVAGIIRCILTAPNTASIASNMDYTYTASTSVYWTIVEADIGVISACLPTLRPVMAQVNLTSIAWSIRNTFSRASRSGSGAMAWTPSSQRSQPEEKNQKGIFAGAPDVRLQRHVTAQSVPFDSGIEHGHGISVTQKFTRTEYSTAA